ncbi:MAG: 50S ribosomal protein L35 [Thermodesulfobacteriota bacterium]
MPKIKTNKGAAKRFRVTGKGKIKMMKAGRRHLLTSKSPGRKRRLGATLVDKTNVDSIRKLLPYS